MDFQRYTGLWHQIAKPRDFKWDKGCDFASAEYSWNPSKKLLNIKNNCLDKHKQTVYSRLGEARPSNPNDTTKLRIIFNDGLPADPEGDYWVLWTDYDDYSIVSGGNSNNYVWILSRSPKVPRKDFLMLVDKLKSLGIDLNTITSNLSLIH